MIFKIINNIVYYINDIDIKNFLICNKNLYNLFYGVFSYNFIERSNIRNLIKLTKEYYNMKEVNKKEFPYIKSYMFSNSFKNRLLNSGTGVLFSILYWNSFHAPKPRAAIRRP